MRVWWPRNIDPCFHPRRPGALCHRRGQGSLADESEMDTGMLPGDGRERVHHLEAALLDADAPDDADEPIVIAQPELTTNAGPRTRRRIVPEHDRVVHHRHFVGGANRFGQFVEEPMRHDFDAIEPPAQPQDELRQHLLPRVVANPPMVRRHERGPPRPASGHIPEQIRTVAVGVDDADAGRADVPFATDRHVRR